MDDVGTILWLEDQRSFFTDIASALEEIGFDVVFSETADDFKRQLDARTFDFVLIDIKGGAFNGIEIYEDSKQFFEQSTVIFLSGWLRDPAIKISLLELGDDVVVMDKVFSSANVDHIRATFASALHAAKKKAGVETNKTYYFEQRLKTSKVRSIEYAEFIRLSSIKRAQIRRGVINKAMRKIDKMGESGSNWFLISAPNGEIIEHQRSRPHHFDSKMLSLKSLEMGVACFVFESGSYVEELHNRSCNAHYEYYFSVDIAFSGTKQVHSIHFDSGAESSWFDPTFLKDHGVGVGLDADHTARMGTMNGPKDFEYWIARVSLDVFSQEATDERLSTELFVNGLSDWKDTFIGGRAPRGRLCPLCKKGGRCERRIGVFGHDLLRNPLCFSLRLNGETGKTAPIFANPKLTKTKTTRD